MGRAEAMDAVDEAAERAKRRALYPHAEFVRQLEEEGQARKYTRDEVNALWKAEAFERLVDELSGMRLVALELSQGVERYNSLLVVSVLAEYAQALALDITRAMEQARGTSVGPLAHAGMVKE